MCILHDLDVEEIAHEYINKKEITRCDNNTSSQYYEIHAVMSTDSILAFKRRGNFVNYMYKRPANLQEDEKINLSFLCIFQNYRLSELGECIRLSEYIYIPLSWNKKLKRQSPDNSFFKTHIGKGNFQHYFRSVFLRPNT